jgi:mRNA interferase HigB
MKPVNVISKRAVRAFAERHPDARKPLMQWYEAARKAHWTHIVEVREEFHAADAVPPFTVFNVGGNKYRVVTELVFPKKLVLIRKILTHAEYDRGAWKR